MGGIYPLINVFETQIHEVQYLWMTLEDLSPLLVRRWKESARNSEFHPEIRRLIGRAGQDMVNIKLAKYKRLIQTIHKELSSLVDSMVKQSIM